MGERKAFPLRVDPALWAAVAPYRGEALHWEEASPTLEDVFIHLMGRARDNALEAA